MTFENAPLSDGVRKVVDDPQRRQILAALDILDTDKDGDFDRLTRIAARLFGTEFAQVTLVDTDRQWFRSCFGVDGLTETDVNVSFCAHTIAAVDREYLVINDLTQDERFTANPFVTGWPGVRFYAGVPIVVRGQRLGTLCVLGTQVRESVDPDLMLQLVDLAELAATLFSLKDEARVRARTAAALIKEEWRHALTLEAGKVGSWVWDIRSDEVACNDMFRRMYGLPETGTVLQQHVLAATHDNDRQQVEAGLAASLGEGVDYSAEARVGDASRWLAIRGRVYQRDADGKPLIMMGASIDISESKHTAEQTRLLLRELNHRVKNTLAMIQSVARQTIRQNPDPREFIEAFSGRLRTISDAHVLLADRDWSGISLYEVVASQLGKDFLHKPDRAEVDGEDIMLSADQALGLGLILHELTTNAHRHGAWSNEVGIVSIRWEVRPEPEQGLALIWKERGGPAVTRPAEYGLGAKLIERSLAKVLDSAVALRFEPTGVAADIWVPLADSSAAAGDYPATAGTA